MRQPPLFEDWVADDDGSVVYFMLCDHVLKIGRTGNVEARRRQFLTSHGRVDLLGTIRGDATRERELHIRFACFNIHVEVFRPDPALMLAVELLIRIDGIENRRPRLRCLVGLLPYRCDLERFETRDDPSRWHDAVRVHVEKIFELLP